MEVVLLLKVPGRGPVGVIPRAEVVDLAAGLPGPAPGGVGEEGELGVRLGRPDGLDARGGRGKHHYRMRPHPNQLASALVLAGTVAAAANAQQAAQASDLSAKIDAVFARFTDKTPEPTPLLRFSEWS